MIDYRYEIEQCTLELNTMPKGYISKKTINGKVRFYHQWVEEGKLRSKYLKEGELEELLPLIERKRELQTRLKEYQRLLNEHRLEKKSDVGLYRLFEFKEMYGKKVYELMQSFRCEMVPSLADYLHTQCWQMHTPYIAYDKRADLIVGFFTLTASSMIIPLEDEDSNSNGDKKYLNHIIPCIEIEHFAINDAYREYRREKGLEEHNLGQKLFHYYIMPKLNDLYELLNFSLVTVHAYNHPKVIEAYHKMGLMTMEEDQQQIIPTLTNVKALYTKYLDGCVFMFQEYEILSNIHVEEDE